jgi:hypothetical protein
MARADWPDWKIFVEGELKCEYCGFDGTESLAVLVAILDSVRRNATV